jgi:phage tail-like protein
MSPLHKFLCALKAAMAVLRDTPYGGFNFRVQLGADPGSVLAGFYEVSGLAAEVGVTEYRSGNDASNAPRKVLGLAKYSDVTLKRGLIGSTDLWDWFRTARDGAPERRDVVIQLLSEDHTQVVMAWRLRGCFPVKYVGPTLRATASDVAVEELVLSVERVDVE